MPVQQVLAAMADAGHEVNMLILDACRDNPYMGQWGSSHRGLDHGQASGGSFARSGRSKHMVLAPPPAHRGMLIAYATAPGGVAADDTGENGVYTKPLLQAMMIPGLSIQQVFRQVCYGVVTETGRSRHRGGPPPCWKILRLCRRRPRACLRVCPFWIDCMRPCL
jgi:uncharacterized caspase-like protein